MDARGNSLDLVEVLPVLIGYSGNQLVFLWEGHIVVL